MTSKDFIIQYILYVIASGSGLTSKRMNFMDREIYSHQPRADDDDGKPTKSAPEITCEIIIIFVKK